MEDDLDRAPDYPPGPRGPEDDEPGPRLRVSAHQARYIGAFVDLQGDAASSVTIEERGAGYYLVTVSGPEGEQLAHRLVYPLANRLPDNTIP